MMQINGLEFQGERTWFNEDFVYNYTTHAIGGGEWSIEAYDDEGSLIREWVGSNGTREPKDDLWARVEEWEKEVAMKDRFYKAPDGTEGIMQFFYKEIEEGRLHGCLITFK